MNRSGLSSSSESDHGRSVFAAGSRAIDGIARGDFSVSALDPDPTRVETSARSFHPPSHLASSLRRPTVSSCISYEPRISRPIVGEDAPQGVTTRKDAVHEGCPAIRRSRCARRIARRAERRRRLFRHRPESELFPLSPPLRRHRPDARQADQSRLLRKLRSARHSPRASAAQGRQRPGHHQSGPDAARPHRHHLRREGRAAPQSPRRVDDRRGRLHHGSRRGRRHLGTRLQDQQPARRQLHRLLRKSALAQRQQQGQA